MLPPDVHLLWISWPPTSYLAYLEADVIFRVISTNLYSPLQVWKERKTEIYGGESAMRQALSLNPPLDSQTRLIFNFC